MPKKFAGENSKAVAAKARKAEKAEIEKNKKEKEIEDAKWADDDKSAKKKQARKEDAERKRQEALEKKQEREKLLAEEDSKVLKEKSGSKKASLAPKITRAQIRDNEEQREKAAKSQAAKEKEIVTHLDTPLEENLNRVDIGSETASNLDEAISVLRLTDSSPSVDKHPEKRMKAAYEEFESIRLPQLKSENPNLRLSQLKQMLRKEWLKHPDNPLNKKLAAMNAN